MTKLASALDIAGEHAEAVLVGRRCLALHKRLEGEEQESTLLSMTNFSLALVHLPGQEPEALKIILRCSELARLPSRKTAPVGPFDFFKMDAVPAPATPMPSFRLCRMDAVHALVLSHNDRHDEAERLARSAVQQGETLTHRKLATYPFALAVLCEVLLRCGHSQEAREQGQRALAAMTEEQDGHYYLAHLQKVLAEVERALQPEPKKTTGIPILDSDRVQVLLLFLRSSPSCTKQHRTAHTTFLAHSWAPV